MQENGGKRQWVNKAEGMVVKVTISESEVNRLVDKLNRPCDHYFFGNPKPAWM